MDGTYDCNGPASRAAGLEAATTSLGAGGVAVIPADSAYALACNAFDRFACLRMRTLKSAPAHAPLSVFVGSWTTIDGLCSTVPATARELVEAFWPGALSLVLNHAPSLEWDIGATRGTVTVRMPLHPVALELLRALGPLATSAAPTADRSEPRTVEAVKRAIGEEASVYLDSGPLTAWGRSTIVDLTGDDVVVLREGALPVAELEAVLKRPVAIAG